MAAIVSFHCARGLLVRGLEPKLRKSLEARSKLYENDLVT